VTKALNHGLSSPLTVQEPKIETIVGAAFILTPEVQGQRRKRRTPDGRTR
jgi:hypothetical protein